MFQLTSRVCVPLTVFFFFFFNSNQYLMHQICDDLDFSVSVLHLAFKVVVDIQIRGTERDFIQNIEILIPIILSTDLCSNEQITQKG